MTWRRQTFMMWFYESNFPDGAKPKSRFVDEWQKPKEIAPGYVLAYRIITPSDGATVPMDESKHHLIKWIPTSPPGKATEIAILIAAYPDNPDSWPGKNSMGTKLVGTLKLENGAIVYVVCSAIERPIFQTKTINASLFKGRSRTDFEEGKLRMLAFATHDDGSRVLYDYPVNVESGN